ncbi:MAG: GAF domain-containing protein [Chloroflexi bacterium]|nr:GAF domain-containing protein [Chloroflexota bacterium]
MRILMVEDEKHDYQIVKRTLDKSDLICKIIWVSCGEDALEYLQNDQFDIVLIDFKLPGINGLDTFKQIIAQGINVPVIFITGSGNESVAVEALKLGAQDYLIKDTTGEYLKFLTTIVHKAHSQWKDTQAREHALQESQARYRILFEHANDAIHIENENDEIIDVNRRACELFGYSREEMLTLHVSDLQAPEVREQESDIVRTEWARYGNTIFEALNIRRDGTRIPVEVSVSKIMGLKGDLYVSIVRDIIERKRAEESLRQRTAQLESLRAVGLELTAQLDLDILLYSVASRAIELLDGTKSGLYLYQKELDALELVVAIGRGAGPIGARLHRGEGLSGKVWETGESLVVDNYQDWDGRYPTFEKYPYAAVIGVPIRWGKTFLGVLNVLSDTPSAFSQADADLLSLLATQAAIAIRNARLYEDSQRHNLEQETVGHIVRALNTLDVRDAFPVLMEGLETLTNCDRASLALPDETGEYFIMSTLESPFPVLEEGTRIPFSSTAAAKDIAAGRIHLTTDLGTETDFFGELVLYQAGFRSRVNLPLLVGGEPIGALSLASRQLACFREDQLLVLQQIADALASAVENSHLFRAERRLRQEADTLREAALALTSALDQPQVIERILAQLQKVVPYDTCSVQLLRKSTEHGRADQFEVVGGRGFPNMSDLLGMSFVIGDDNPNSEVIRRQAPIIVADAPTEYPHFLHKPHAQAGIHSWLGVQMGMGEELIGMITLDKQESGFYTQEHARLAQAFASQAAIAIENARLYEQAQQDAETRAVLLNEVNHRVKNNLTGILGLLYTARTSAKVSDRATYQSTMDDLIGRVRGLSTVHSMLSASEWSPLPLSDLAAKIIYASIKTLPRTKRVSVDVTPSPVRVTSDQAHNLALVINELSTNVIKYALQERDSARIAFRIAFDENVTQSAPLVRCEFRDDGPGYPEDVLKMERHNVGFDLIQNIVRGSLRGDLSLYNDRGAVAILRFQTKV